MQIQRLWLDHICVLLNLIVENAAWANNSWCSLECCCMTFRVLAESWLAGIDVLSLILKFLLLNHAEVIKGIFSIATEIVIAHFVLLMLGWEKLPYHRVLIWRSRAWSTVVVWMTSTTIRLAFRWEDWIVLNWFMGASAYEISFIYCST